MRVSTPLFVVAFLATAAAAHAQTAGFETPARFAFMKDLSTDTILMTKNADERVPPASMGKMMTVYVAFDLIKRGKVSLNQKILVSPETWAKWHSQGSTMFLGVGEQPTVADLLHGIVTLSGNDACVVLAEGLAGTEANYVAIMNQTAKRLGLRNSNFANTTGWPDPNEWVSARDLATIAERTIEDHPKLYREFYGKPSFTWGKTLGAAQPITQGNRNPLLGKVPGADGLKTGHTDEAGYGFTGSAIQNGRRIVMVIGGMSSWNERVQQSVGFMNWGFAAFETVPLARKGVKLGEAEVYLGDKRTVALVAPRAIAATVPRAQSDAIKLRIVYTGPVKAPIAAGRCIVAAAIGTSGRRRAAEASASKAESCACRLGAKGVCRVTLASISNASG